MWNNKDFVDNTFKSFFEFSKNRKLVLFGAGDKSTVCIKEFLDPNGLEVNYIIDNDFRLWHSKHMGFNIYPVTQILKEPKDSYVILITLDKPYRIAAYLEDLQVGNYFSSHLFLEPYFEKYIKRVFCIFF